MSLIKVKTSDQNIVFTDSPRIYSGDVNTDTIHFTFDPVWDGFTRTAVFYRELDKPYFQVLDENDECIVPKEVLADAGKFYVGVVGVLDEKVLTSEVIAYEIGQGIMTPVETPPSADVWAQILAELASVRVLAQEIKQNESDFMQDVKEENKTFQDSFTELGKDLTDLTDMIQEKHDNGEFDGKSVIYGEENPSNDIGNDGDVYIKTTETEPYPYYLFTKDNGTWTPQFTVRGKNGYDGNPVGTIASFAGELPEGYEEVSPPFCNENILANADFKSGIINQMGKSQYDSVNNWTLCIDRWIYIGNMQVFVGADKLRLKATSANTGSANFKQRVYNAKSGTKTLYVNVESVTSTVNITIAGTQVGTLKNGKNEFVINSDLKDFDVLITLVGTNADISILEMKLEQGEDFTGMPDWNESAELLKCYLNQYALGTGWGNQYHVRSDESSFRVFIQTPVRMRKNPSLRDLSDNSNLVVTGSQNSTVQQIPVSNVKSISISDNGVYIDFSLGSFKQIGYGQAVFSGRLLLDANEY